MGYAIIRTKKIKTAKVMTATYNHNLRVVQPDNADPAKRSMNQELLDNLNGRSYMDAYKETIRSLQMQGAICKKIRKDAVWGIEVCMAFSREAAETVDLEEWKSESMAWLTKRFNPPEQKIHFTDPITGDEREVTIQNVKHAIMHCDESVPHIHAFVVPIDDRGTLNAKYYVGGRMLLIGMQNEYANAVKTTGLKRGVHYTSARHTEMIEYYSRVKENLKASLPPEEPGETVEEYKVRADTEYINAMVRIQQLQQDLEKTRSMLLGRERQIRMVTQGLGMEEDSITPWALQEIRKLAQEQKDLEEAMENYPDQKKVCVAEEYIQEILSWKERREQEAKKVKAFTHEFAWESR